MQPERAGLLAGLIETARLGASDAPKAGLYIELDAIAAVVVGGMERMLVLKAAIILIAVYIQRPKLA